MLINSKFVQKTLRFKKEWRHKFNPECFPGLDGEGHPSKCRNSQPHPTTSYHCEKKTATKTYVRHVNIPAYDGSVVRKQIKLTTTPPRTITISPSAKAVTTNASTTVMLVTFITAAFLIVAMTVVLAVCLCRRRSINHEKQRSIETGRQDFIYRTEPAPA